MSELRKVLFVCTANICRSPMAEAIFNELARERGLSITAESAGVRARSGHDMAPYAREALEEIGIYTSQHTSRRVDETLISESDLILTMEPEQRDTLRKISDDPGRVSTLIEFAGGSPDDSVSDPYGMTLFAYRASVRQIFDYVEKVLGRLDQ